MTLYLSPFWIGLALGYALGFGTLLAGCVWLAAKNRRAAP